jgi:hypothetical protein
MRGWIHLTQDSVQWWVSVSMVMNLRVPKNVWNLTKWADISSSRRILSSASVHITRVPIGRDFHFAPKWLGIVRGAAVPHIHKLWTSWNVRPADPSMHFMIHLNLHSLLCGRDHSTVVVGNCNLPQFSAGFEVLTAVVMNSSIFWDTRPCRMLKVKRFGRTYRLRYQRHTRRYIPSLQLRRSIRRNSFKRAL